MLMLKRFIPLILLTISIVCCADFKLAECSIAIPENASAVEKRAASQLASYLFKTTGKKIPVVPENKINIKQPIIYVGHTAFAANKNIDVKKLNREEWLIRSFDNALVLTGGFNRGIIYSVYDYLEQQAKIRVYDEHTIKIVKNPDLRSGKWNLQRKPSFDARWIYDCLDWSKNSDFLKEFNKGYSYTQTQTGMHKLVGGDRPYHTAHDYMKYWPKDKKNLYALQPDGSRPVPKNPIGPGQMCLTDPEVRELVIAQLRKFIETDRKNAKANNYPSPVFYDISHNDNYHKCVCKNCMAIAEREGSYAGTLIEFINHIARNIAKDYPDVIIRTFAYTYTALPPKNIKTEPNVSMHLAFLGAEMGGEYYEYDSMRKLSHPLNNDIKERIKKWSAYSNYICRWEYWRLFPSIPEVNLRFGSLAEDIKRNYDCNVRYLFAEYEYPHWNSFFALTRYLGYKLLDNVNANADALKAEFMRDYYGKGADAMNELLDFMLKSQDSFQYRIGSFAPGRRNYMDENYFKTAFALIEKAERAASGDPQSLTHIRMERAPLTGSLLFSRPYLKNFEKSYNFNKLLAELEKLSTSYIKYYYGNDSQRKSAEKGLKNAIKSLQAYNYKAEAPDMPGNAAEKAIVLSALQFSQSGKAKLTNDSNAFIGKAMQLPFPAKKELSFILNDWMEPGEATIPFNKKQLPIDGKYHWISLGDYPFVNNGRYQLYVTSPKELCIGFYRQFPADTTAEIFISVKRTENAIFVDRVVIVPKSVKKFELPKQFTGKKVNVFPWGVVKRANGTFTVKDTAGAWNGAAALTSAGKTKNKITEFGVYSPHSKKVLASTRIHSDNIRNENYNLVKIGKFKASNGIFFYAGANWAMQFPFRWVSGNGTLYASVKFSGPQYVKGSKNPDALMIDYLLFVKD